MVDLKIPSVPQLLTGSRISSLTGVHPPFLPVATHSYWLCFFHLQGGVPWPLQVPPDYVNLRFVSSSLPATSSPHMIVPLISSLVPPLVEDLKPRPQESTSRNRNCWRRILLCWQESFLMKVYQELQFCGCPSLSHQLHQVIFPVEYLSCSSLLQS